MVSVGLISTTAVLRPVPATLHCGFRLMCKLAALQVWVAYVVKPIPLSSQLAQTNQVVWVIMRLAAEINSHGTIVCTAWTVSVALACHVEGFEMPVINWMPLPLSNFVVTTHEAVQHLNNDLSVVHTTSKRRPPGLHRAFTPWYVISSTGLLHCKLKYTPGWKYRQNRAGWHAEMKNIHDSWFMIHHPFRRMMRNCWRCCKQVAVCERCEWICTHLVADRTSAEDQEEARARTACVHRWKGVLSCF